MVTTDLPPRWSSIHCGGAYSRLWGKLDCLKAQDKIRDQLDLSVPKFKTGEREQVFILHFRDIWIVPRHGASQRCGLLFWEKVGQSFTEVLHFGN